MDIFETLSRAMVERESFRVQLENLKTKFNEQAVEIAKVAALVVGEPEYKDGQIHVADAMRNYIQRLRFMAHEKCSGTNDCHPLEVSDGQ